MWNKIYFAVLVVAVFVMSFFTFYAYSWLGSIGDPRDALAGYEFYAGFAFKFLLISTAILLILANVILWTLRHRWAIWISFAYFEIFIILRFFWLEKAYHEFIHVDTFFFTPFIGAILIIIAGIVIFFNQFLSLRLHQKMYPPQEPIENNKIVKLEE